MIIYGVSIGRYSDYYVKTLFSEEKDAQRYVDEYNKTTDKYDDARVEEFSLDEEMDEICRDVYTSQVTLDTGDVKEIGMKKCMALPSSRTLEPLNWHLETLCMSLVSQEHANKLCAEARQKWLREKDLAKEN